MMDDDALIKKIVAFTHNGNKEIIETRDFIEGIQHTLKYLRKTKALKTQPKK